MIIKTKRFICIFLSFAMLMGIVMPISAYADEETTFYLQSADAYPGEEVSVTIGILFNSGLTSASISIEYEEAYLNLIHVQDERLLSGALHAEPKSSPYTMSWINDMDTVNNTKTGILVTLTFAVKSDAKVGSTLPIRFRTVRDSVLDCNGDSVACTMIDGAIRVVEKACVHDWGDWEPYSTRKHERTCILCEETESESHEWDNGIVTKQPTTTASGVKTYTCVSCGYTRIVDIPPTEHTHTYTVHQLIAPTCTQGGYTLYKCSCGETKQDDFVSATGHKYAVNRVVAATCQSAGYTVEICSACGVERRTNPVPAVDHRYINDVCTYCGVTNPSTPDIPETSEPETSTPDLPSHSSIVSCGGIGTKPEEEGELRVVFDFLNPTEQTLRVRYDFYSHYQQTVGADGIIELAPNSAGEKPGQLIAYELGTKDFYATLTYGNVTEYIYFDWAERDHMLHHCTKWQDLGTGMHRATCLDCGTTLTLPHVFDDADSCNACHSSIPANAPTLSASDVTTRVGETVRVPIYLHNNPGITSMRVFVSFDPEVLTLTNVIYNSEMGGMSVPPEYAKVTNMVTLYWTDSFRDYTGDGLFATLEFTVTDSESYKGTESAIRVVCKPGDAYDITETDILFIGQSGTINITKHIPGDINGDGVCNTKDTSRLMQYFAGWDVAVDPDALDVNGDGVANTKDTTRLMQYLAGWEVDIH